MQNDDDALIAEVSRRLSAAAPGAKVILFGSRSRGDARPESDLDLLVVEPEDISNRGIESARLRRELRGLDVALDLIVVSAAQARELESFKGSVLNEALHNGRVLVES